MPRQAPVHLVRTSLASLCGLVLVATIALTDASAASAAPSGSPTPAAGAARVQAEKALSLAERLLGSASDQHRSATSDRSDSGPRRDATLALRELSLHRADLSAADQLRASRLLARPVTNAALGTGDVVVHYTAGQVAPGYPQLVLDTATKVRQTYLAAGYRLPKSDGALGGDGRFDIYLSDLATTGAYGYCTSDEPGDSGGSADRWAYCVLDNSYTKYPGVPTQVLQVTLAHEYFHAVQYAYDSFEDGWMVEGTAAWVEDYIYDDVNDNMQYAPFSALAGPRFSLDQFKQGGFRQYGAWLWFRWLSERYPDAQGGLPVIIRQIWEAADGTGGGSDLYSLKAINKVLKQRGTTLKKSFALFADANRRPASAYSEAVANGYPTAPLAKTVKLSKRGSKSRAYKLDHLTSATTRFVPKKLASRKFRLRLSLDLADKRAGSAAVISTYLRTGQVKTKYVKLNGRGNATTKVPFSTKKVSGVEVTLVNASQRFKNCYRVAVTYSCYGKPVDQNVVERVRASVVR